MITNKLIESKCGKINIIEGKHTENIKGIIIHIHGIGSHFQYVYDSLDELSERDSFFSDMNYKSFAFEFYGHGKSDGERCHINDFNDLVCDLVSVIKYIKTIYKDIKFFLLAESMGCAVVLKHIIDSIHNKSIESPSGIILLCPLCGLDDRLKPPKILIKLLTIISYITPKIKLTINNSNTSSDSSSNSEYLKIKNMCNQTYKPPYMLCTIREIYNISSWIPNNVADIEIPILIFYGLNDKLIPFDSVKTTFEKIKFSDKELIILPESEHLILVPNTSDDLTPYFVYIKILNWLNSKIVK
jgi:alpha-beta hydrolase superfamily lysophospholipase